MNKKSISLTYTMAIAGGLFFGFLLRYVKAPIDDVTVLSTAAAIIVSIYLSGFFCGNISND